MTSWTTCACFLLGLITFSCVIAISQSEPIATKDKLTSSSSSSSANAIQVARFVSSSAATAAASSSSSSTSTQIILGHSDSHVTAQVGHPAYLKCAVSNLASDQAVSWVRRRDWHILTSGRHVYTADERFQILRPIASSSDNEPLSSSSGVRKFDVDGINAAGSGGGGGGVNLTEWILQIQFVQQRDAGLYICQVPTEKGMISHQVQLDVLVPDVFILGPKDLIVDRGTTLSLVCIVENSPIPPQFVFWYHNDKLLNYQPKREGVLVETEYSGRTHSKLEIVDAHETDTGNYTCSTSSGKPYSIYVQVLAGIGDQAAAMSRKNSAPSFVFWQQLTVVHVVTLLHQLISRLFINAV